MASSLWLPAPTRAVPPPPGGGGGGGGQQQQHTNNRGGTNPNTNGDNNGNGQLVPRAATTAAATGKNKKRATTTTTTVPSYEQRCNAAKQFSKLTPGQRKSAKPLFVPRRLADFDDGGAFPEIHVAQYPRNMGNPHLAKKKGLAVVASVGKGGKGGGPAGVMALNNSNSIVNVEIDSTGKVSYDAIVTGGTNTNKTVYTRHSDLKGGEPDPEDVALPSTNEEEETRARTEAALQSLVNTKVAALKPTGSAMTQAATSVDQEAKTQFIKYTPNPDAPGYNPAAAQRVIQMVPAQIDPMQPPKHKHKKAPRGPAEDPVPVLHAPPKKLTKEEQDAWKVPACISNWKNTRGYTIPLDKRLAADGRGLREHTINSNFATLSESLYVAERQAREEVRMRSLVQKRLAQNEKEKREEELRKLANMARMERTGQGQQSLPQQQQQIPVGGEESHGGGGRAAAVRRADNDTPDHSSAEGGGSDDDTDHEEEKAEARRPDNEEAVAAAQRERLRIERKKERERELRLENLKGDAKKRKLDGERDVSEKIALGQMTGHGGGTAGGAVDTRLYNTSSGMDSGFGADDEYNAYTKPLFDRDAAAKSIYKPGAGGDDAGIVDADEAYEELKTGSTKRFQPDKGFAGAEGSASGAGSAGPRNEPVQFERASEKK